MTEKLSDKVYIEELKLFTSAMFELDKRIIQVFGFTMALSVTLLTWIGKILFEHTEESALILPTLVKVLPSMRMTIGYIPAVLLLIVIVSVVLLNNSNKASPTTFE